MALAKFLLFCFLLNFAIDTSLALDKYCKGLVLADGTEEGRDGSECERHCALKGLRGHCEGNPWRCKCVKTSVFN